MINFEEDGGVREKTKVGFFEREGTLDNVFFKALDNLSYGFVRSNHNS